MVCLECIKTSIEAQYIYFESKLTFMFIILTEHVRSREGNVFTRMCDSVHGGTDRSILDHELSIPPGQRTVSQPFIIPPYR